MTTPHLPVSDLLERLDQCIVSPLSRVLRSPHRLALPHPACPPRCPSCHSCRLAVAVQLKGSCPHDCNCLSYVRCIQAPFCPHVCFQPCLRRHPSSVCGPRWICTTGCLIMAPSACRRRGRSSCAIVVCTLSKTTSTCSSPGAYTTYPAAMAVAVARSCTRVEIPRGVWRTHGKGSLERCQTWCRCSYMSQDGGACNKLMYNNTSFGQAVKPVGLVGPSTFSHLLQRQTQA